MFLLMSWLGVSGCAPSTLGDLRLEGEAETRKLAMELKAIDTKEELSRAVPRLKRRYNRLADLLLEARKFEEKGGEPSLASEELFAELARLYEIPGGRELVESAQEEAVRRLSRAF
ncbi:MAG TPA: hypothetical protein VLE89_07320 [Chlamydiales bacterium]|nr:hypothetical protein [Chlamydiales bacterium]